MAITSTPDRAAGPPYRTLRSGNLTLQEVCNRFSLSPRQLRYYERSGYLREVPRGPSSGHREYALRHLVVLERLARYQAMGFSLAEASDFANQVGDLSRVPVRRLVEVVNRTLTRMQQQLQASFLLTDALCARIQELETLGTATPGIAPLPFIRTA